MTDDELWQVLAKAGRDNWHGGALYAPGGAAYSFDALGRFFAEVALRALGDRLIPEGATLRERWGTVDLTSGGIATAEDRTQAEWWLGLARDSHPLGGPQHEVVLAKQRQWDFPDGSTLTGPWTPAEPVPEKKDQREEVEGD